ncbi:unnamed protein product [Closterium sp. NIES-53]
MGDLRLDLSWDGGVDGGIAVRRPNLSRTLVSVKPVLSPSASRARLSRVLAPAAPASRRPCCPVPSRRPCCPVAPAVPSRRPCRRVAPAVPSRPVAPAVLSRRPYRRVVPAVPSRPVAPAVPSPLLSRLVAPAVASPLLSRPVPSPLLSRRVALSSLLPESEETHFTQVRTASEFLTPIKARYATPTTVSLGRLYRAACTDAQLALLPPPMAITIYFIATSLPDRLASVRDALLLKHPSELTIEVLESALKDVESNLRSVASASGVVPPPMFHGCTVPQLPTFTASLATAATGVTVAAVTTSSRSRGRSGRRGGQGAGGGGGGGGGDVASGGGGTAGGGATAWYLTRRQQQQQPLPSQQPQQKQWQQQVSGQGSGQRQLQRGVVHPPCTYHVLAGARRNQPCGRNHPPGMSASQLVDLFRTPHAMYAVVDSSASDSVYSSVVSLGASLAEVPVASVGTCADTSPGAAPEDASLSFTLDSGASQCFFLNRTTLTLLPTPVSVALADPTSRPVTARYTTTLPCPAVPSGSLTGFPVPSFSRNLVGVRPLVSQHAGVWIEPSGETAVCVDGDTYTPLATLIAEPGSGLYTLHTGPRGQQ